VVCSTSVYGTSEIDMHWTNIRPFLYFDALFQRLASDFLSNYIFITVGRVGSSTDLIEQTILLVSDREKQSFLLDELEKQSVAEANSKVCANC